MALWRFNKVELRRHSRRRDLEDRRRVALSNPGGLADGVRPALLQSPPDKTKKLKKMKTTQPFAFTFVVLSLLGSSASAAVTSTDEIFTRITTGRIVTDGGQSGSAAAVDYDGDGWPDIYVGNGGGGSDALNFLYRNNGDGTFARTTVAGVTTDLGKTVSAAWGDYDNDGFPDLVVAHWPNQNNFQYRNNGDGQFTKITQGPIVSDAGSIDGCVWGDYDRDGWLDLFVPMDSGDHRLYRNNRDGIFSRVADLPTVGAASYSAWVDYDNDGFPDLFVPAWRRVGKNALYHNDGNGTFTLITNSPLSSEGGLSLSTPGAITTMTDFPTSSWRTGIMMAASIETFFITTTAMARSRRSPPARLPPVTGIQQRPHGGTWTTMATSICSL